MRITDYSDGRVVEKYYKKTLAADYINYPAVLKLLRGISGKTVLDLGCGAGWLAGKLSRRGALVYGLDNSPKWISICRKQNGRSGNIRFITADSANLKIFRNGMFDVIIANMVFLCVPSRQKLIKTFREVSRILKKDGLFIFSDCHPVTNMIGPTCTKVSGRVPGFSYFDDGAKYKSTYLLSDYSRIDFVDSHWSMGFYSDLLNRNNMAIERILEPKPVRMDPGKRFKNYEAPEYIMFKCRKFK